MGKKKRTRKLWTEQELEDLRILYPDVRTDILAEWFGRSLSSVYGAADKHGLKKSEAFLASENSGRLTKLTESGRVHRFKKGSVPWNKGKKIGSHPNAIATQFKAGHKPHNTAERDGEIRIRHGHKKRGGKPYKWIRISEANWMQLHKYTWEQTNGPVPEGMIIVFKDGDTMNCDLSNLEMISRGENMKRNTIHNYPEEIKEVMRLRSKLQRKISQHAT